MMTNSEAIMVDLKGIANILIREDLCSIEPIEKAISALEENAKLKAEIEKLKGELKSEREFRANARIELLDRKTEIEQLKSELEQSVRLPLTNADKIRSMSDEELAEVIQDIWCDNHGDFVDKLLSKSANPICILEMLKREVSE